MFKFVKSEDNLVLKAGVFSFKKLSVSINRNRYGAMALTLDRFDEKSAIFSSDFAKVKLELAEENDVLALKATGELIVSPTDKLFCDSAELCLNEDGAVFIRFKEIDTVEAWNASVLTSTSFWTEPKYGTEIADISQKVQALLLKFQDDFGLIYAPCDKKFKSSFMGTKNGFQISLTSLKQGLCSFDETVMLFSASKKPYELPEKIVEFGLKFLEKDVLPVEQKKFPETLEYLGWCSWDAFPLSVTHQGLLDKAAEFKEKNIPVRWFMIDDMWAELDGENSRDNMHKRKLRRFTPDPKQFPKGLKAAITEVKENLDVMVGIWHPITGYWRGFAPEGEIAEKYSEFLTQVEGERLAIIPTEEAFFGYHNIFYDYLKSSGVDFVKVDNQSSLVWFYRHIGLVGEMARGIHKGLEKAVDKYFGGTMINCMGCSAENIWNRPRSLVNRCSADFLPENKAWFIKHILQCTNATYYYSPLFCGDFDMFWTDDTQGQRNAVLRAMSGGPIYVSDKVNRSVAEILMPCVLSNGRILRCNCSARPTKDCLVTNPTTSNNAYNIWNVTDNSLLIASFNLSDNDSEVTGTVSPFEIIENTQSDVYVSYNYFEKKINLIKKGEAINFTLANQEQFYLLSFVPLISGIAPIGLTDKYVSGATFSKLSSNKFLVKNGGEFAFYCEKEPISVVVDNQDTTPTKKTDYYLVNLADKENEHIVEIVV